MTLERIPPALTRYIVERDTLRTTEVWLRESGEEGLEAVVLWIGYARDSATAVVAQPYFPEQVAYRGPDGVAVEVTQDGLARLISSLPPGNFVLCRVHSHPREAYHSQTDDLNLLIGHPGAISIVVPNFAREPIELTGCSVNRLEPGSGWRELTAAEVVDLFDVT